MRTAMTHQERQIADALAKSLSLDPNTSLIVNLDATTVVGGDFVEGAGIWLVGSSGQAPLHLFAPWNLFASALVRSLTAWGPEVATKLKPYQAR